MKRVVMLFAIAGASGVVAAQTAANAGLPEAALRFTWVRIQPATFDMGCVDGDTACRDAEKPNHRVTISRAFDVMSTPLTVAAYRALGFTPAQQPPGSSDESAVVFVTWDEAVATCRMASSKGRLLTEAEWELAARGGRRGSIYPWGNEDPVNQRGAVNGAHLNLPTGRGPAGAGHPVAAHGPNGFGLYDMVGNVGTWLADWYDEKYYQQAPGTDPKGPPSGQLFQAGANQVPHRSVRGGVWFDGVPPRNLRASARQSFSPVNGVRIVGIRCARDVD